MAVIDEFTREYLALEAAASIKSDPVKSAVKGQTPASFSITEQDIMKEGP